MLSQFIQTNKRKQLKIIQEILRRGTVGTLTLAETVQLSERLLKRYVQTINSELSSMEELVFIEKIKMGC